MLEIKNQQQCSNLIQTSTTSKIQPQLHTQRQITTTTRIQQQLRPQLQRTTTTITFTTTSTNTIITLIYSSFTYLYKSIKLFNYFYLQFIIHYIIIFTYLYKSINLFNYFYLQFIIYSIITYILQLLYFTRSTLLIPNYYISSVQIM